MGFLTDKRFFSMLIAHPLSHKLENFYNSYRDKGTLKPLKYYLRSLKMEGLRWNIDASQTKGSRFSKIELKGPRDSDWENLNLDRCYKVATNNYSAAGKDGYKPFGDRFKVWSYGQYIS